MCKTPPVAEEQVGSCPRCVACSQPDRLPHAGRAAIWVGQAPQALPQRSHPAHFLYPEQPGGLRDGKSFWFQGIQETASLECGLPGEVGSLFLKEGLFNTLLLCPCLHGNGGEAQTRNHFLGEGRADPLQTASSLAQSLSCEPLHLQKAPSYRDPIWVRAVTRRVTCDPTEPRRPPQMV